MAGDPIKFDLEQTVVRSARAFTRCVAEFPDDLSIWAEHLDALDTAVARLDQHLDQEWAKRMA